MKQLIALFVALVVSTVSAQTVQTTPNLITSGTSHTWSGVQTGAIPSGCATAGPCPGGPTPKYDPATNTVHFSYNANAYVGQVMQINQALANAGAGVKINGYTYSYDVRNMNGDDRQPGIDTFTVATVLRGPNNSSLLSSNQYFNTKFDWTTYSGTKTATTPYNIADTTYLQIGITGGDNGYWGGYFGPQIRNVDMRLKYSVDPCVANPAYSPTCANYNTVNTSGNLVPNTTGYAVSGSSIDQSYAINQALALSGANIMIHGFQWGYQANANGPYCAAQFLVCWDNRTPSVTTNVDITSNTGASLYNVSRTYTNSYNTTNYQYVFPSSRNLATLGNFNFTASTNDVAYIGDMWSKALYTPDPCTVNPLSSTSCPGYAQAYQDQQCSANPLYATVCPGYAAAYLTQQCSANPLYSPSCPGYTSAYFTQQCSANPLYSQDCPGYAQAYKTQQCSLSALYATDCPGYQQAYLTQQCNISQLYSTSCPGYQTAYHDQQCSISALYMSDCPGYQQAYFSQQCTANPLYNNQCPGYQVAYKNQQCSLNALYASDCPGYAAAYHDSQCTANPLYMSDCPGYQVAYKAQQCGISALYATDCPGYQQAYFAQQCQLNGLYDRTCPNYATAYAAKNILATPTITPPAATSTVVIATESTATVTSNPAASAISDPVVSSVVSAPSTTSTTSPTSVTSVIAAPAAVTSPAATAAATPVTVPVTPAAAEAKAVEAKKTDTAVATVERKSGGNKENARAAATERAKELANEAGKATTMEAQTATQGLVVGLMGYVPGFNAYQNSIVPDAMANAVARQYHKPNVDNRNAQRRLSGASEVKWQEMVDSQYNNNKGN